MTWSWLASVLIGSGVGSVSIYGIFHILRRFSGPISKALISVLHVVEKWALTADDKAEDALPLVLQGDYREAHTWWDAKVTAWGKFFEEHIFHPKVIDKLLYILGGNREKYPERFTEMAIETVKAAKTELDIPDNLWEPLNEAKRLAAEEQLSLVAAAMPEPIRPTPAAITASVVAVAPALGKTIPVVPAANLGRTAETQALIESLRQKQIPAAQ